MEILNLTAVAGFLAILVAALTAMKLVSENFERFTTSFRRWRDRRNKPKYILVPTPEELAKFSVQEPQRHYPSARELELEQREALLAALWTSGQMRVVPIMIVFICAFALIGGRLVYLGFSSPG